MRLIKAVATSRLLAAFLFLMGIGELASVATFMLPPPGAARAQYVDQGTWGGTSSGSANAQSITIANYDGDAPGVVLRFIPGFTNTGPATISINGRSPVALQRPSSIGLVAFSGQEFLVSEPTAIMFTGGAYKLMDNIDMTPIGQVVETRGGVAPRGSLIEDGSCISRTTYAPLFSVIGTSYGACDGSTTFAINDSRGTVFAALDNQGSHGSANRITSAGSGCAASSLTPSVCGSQNYTLNTGNLPPYTPSGTNSTSFASDAGGRSIPVSNATITTSNAGTVGSVIVPANAGTWAGVNGLSVAAQGFTGQAQGGLSQPFATLQPTSLGLRAIKF